MNRRHSFPLILVVALLVACMVLVPSGPTVAGMTDYCQVPPYVIQNIPPNVLILLDISGSMLNNAYSDGYQTPTNTADDHSCTSTDRCTQYNWTGRPVSHRYYGYFDPDQWYTFGSNVFSPKGPRTGARPANSWSGDFLNWLTMRRIDVMRKVLTGGRPNGTKIDGQIADDPIRGLYKQITATEASENTPYTEDVYFVFDTGNSGTSKFDVVRVSNGNNIDTNISVNVTVPLPVEGVLQTVVGARARVGLEFYNTNTGGKIITDVGKDKVSGGKTVSSLYGHDQSDQPLESEYEHPAGRGVVDGDGILRATGHHHGLQLPLGHGPELLERLRDDQQLGPDELRNRGVPPLARVPEKFRPPPDGRGAVLRREYPDEYPRLSDREIAVPMRGGHGIINRVPLPAEPGTPSPLRAS